MIKIYQAVAFKCGYVESNSVSWVVFRVNERGKIPVSKKEALFSLTEYLFKSYLNYREEKIPQKYWDILKNDKTLCLEDIKSLRKKENSSLFDFEDFQSYIWSYHGMDNDSSGYYEDNSSYGWTYYEFDFELPQEQILIINENAEEIFTRSLIRTHPELIKLQKSNSFYLRKEDEKLEDNNLLIDEKYQRYNFTYLPASELENSRVEYKNQNRYDEIIIRNYENGGQMTMINFIITQIKYNTGDVIHLEFDGENYQVVKALGHDGVNWEK